MTYPATTPPPSRNQVPGAATTLSVPPIRSAPPPGGARWRAVENDGYLHLFIVGSGGIQQVSTQYGESPVVHCDHIVRWNDSGAAVRWDSQPVFGAVLTSQLSAGGVVAGTIGRGTAQPGQNPPWMILEATTEQLDWIRSQWTEIHDANGVLVVPHAEETSASSDSAKEAPF